MPAFPIPSDPAVPARLAALVRRGASRLGVLAAMAAMALLAGASPPARGQTLLSEATALREQIAAHARAGATQAQGEALARLAEIDRSARSLNDLGLFISDQGDFARAQALLAEAVAAAPADQRGLYQANLALNLRRQFLDPQAETLLEEALRQIDAYDGPLTGWRRCNLSRSKAVALLQRSRIAERRGQLDRALALAGDAQQAAAAALEQVPFGARADERALVAADLANAIRREVYVHVQAQRADAAEQALQRWRDLAQRAGLGVAVLAQAQAAQAALEMSRQRFADAETAARAADGLYQQQQLAPHHLSRVTVLETWLAALWAQQRAAEAAPLLDRLDRAAAGHPAAEPVVQMPLLRGLVYLDGGRAAEAVALFEAQAGRMQATAGAGSLSHAEATGLAAAAQWAAGNPAQRDGARAALGQAVGVLSAPLNAGAPDGSGLRSLIRQRVVQAWVASQAVAAGPPPAQAFTLMDWSGNSPVQQAVTQAAVRMAIRDTGLRELVRSEQDLRRAIDALTRSGGDDGRSSRPPAPAVAAAVNTRVQALQAELAEVAGRIRSRHPDYASLTQPVVPTPEQVTRALQPGEGLLVVAPHGDHTLLWLIRANAPMVSHRVALPAARLQALVSRLRSTLEFPEQGRLPPFDRAASAELHRLLIQPVQADLKGLRHLVVAAQGPLASLPLAVLAPDDGKPYSDADWLIRHMAVSQSPSLHAWLATRSLPARGDAPLTLLGWGDPQFGKPAGVAETRRKAPAAVRPAAAFALTRAAAKATSRDAPDPGEAFPSLPETRDELMAMAQALGADPQRQLFLGAQATRDSILEASRSGRLAQSRVVAFATHGLKAGQWPGLD
ncbi:MAG: hypothetical protein RJA10_3484, partial [Pseudomonadota bacterium]